MIKPTKTTGLPASPDSPNINSSNTGNRVPIPGSSGTFAPGTHQLPGISTPHSPGSEVTGNPRVVVSPMTDPVIETNARLAEIALPESEIHLLQPHESVDGFFVHPDGQTYAHLEEGAHYRVELNTASDYQIRWSEAPGVTPPILKKIDGQPLWRIEAPWYTAQSRQSNLPAPRQPAETLDAIIFVDPHLATLLPAAKDFPDGIRPGPRRNTYVDIVGGTVQVRRNEQGEYKMASATTINVPDITFEQIPGHFLWRRKLQAIADTQQDPQPGSSRALTQPEESGPGPSKRPRLPADSDPLDPMPTSELLNSWGSTTKPLAGDSIEIDGGHFAILDQPGHATDALAFIKPPQFSATRFDAFEQMLLTTPELQPRGVVKLADMWTGRGGDKWRVVPGLPFAKSLTQIVSDQFAYLSEHSANKVAREMFNRANHSDEMTGKGLHALFDTFKYWESRNIRSGDNSITHQDLSDPLILLSPLATDANGNRHMPLPTAEGLQRIDFDPRLFFGSRHQRARPETRTLFKDLLHGHGYRILHDFADHGNALLISRTGVDHVFIMFMDKFYGDTFLLHEPIAWLKKSTLSKKMGAHVKNKLKEHLRTNTIIYLLGTQEPLPTRDYNLVVTRYS
jgi:hypothetical protein